VEHPPFTAKKIISIVAFKEDMLNALIVSSQLVHKQRLFTPCPFSTAQAQLMMCMLGNWHAARTAAYKNNADDQCEIKKCYKSLISEVLLAGSVGTMTQTQTLKNTWWGCRCQAYAFSAGEKLG
jgi:hypothetical protein